MLAKLKEFLKSTLNKLGLTGLLTTLVYSAAGSIAAHSFNWPVFVAGAVGSLALILVPDSTVIKADASEFVLDGLTAITGKQPAEIVKVFEDAGKIASDVVSQPPKPVSKA